MTDSFDKHFGPWGLPVEHVAGVWDSCGRESRLWQS